ncbi:MAG: type II toxin-antitoxin system VapC family toxin [Planctomycetes bacterium]|nr:type II toxin-antitoxin system VapC family toxin [Planctomycetota bacterium]
MRKLLLDTHIWVWQVEGSSDQPAGVRRLLASDGVACWISPITVWEVLLLGERGRLTFAASDPHGWVRRALRETPCAEAPLTHDVAMKSREIPLPHRDPADRFIAATALVYGFELVTCDRRLDGIPGLRIVSR